MEKQIEEKQEEEMNWSEKVEDLVASRDADAAISFLETLVSTLESRSAVVGSGEPAAAGDLQLAAVLNELANLYSSKSFSLKSDELRLRSSLLKQRALRDPDDGRKDDWENVASGGFLDNGHLQKSSRSTGDNLGATAAASDDDWEAVADRDPTELLPSEGLPDVSKLSVEETKIQGPKRRGRGTFSYKRNELYSDRDYDETFTPDAEDHDHSSNSERNADSLKTKYGTRHVLVLAGFSPSMRTADLEKLFEEFKDHGVVIRWVNDTTVLAVFRTPSTALEACNRVRCPFTVRILRDDDPLLGLISARDLEPPCQRPKTSARTAQRLIAQGMGLKLPSSAFGSKELRSQEEVRRNRIATRQKLRDDAWGDD